MDPEVDHAEPPPDAAIVERLIQAQHPRLLSGPVRWAATGWDNHTFRVGSTHAVRLPCREEAVALTLNEHRWLPKLAAHLGIPTPVPTARGTPSDLFPRPWSIVPWFEGNRVPLSGLDRPAAMRLANFLRALHRPAPTEAPSNPYRGVPLSTRRDVVETRLTALGLDPVHGIWDQALAAQASDSRRWLHGDLHPGNVLVHEGELAAVIDWGDLCAGDPATDLACAWLLMDAVPRARFRDAYNPDQHLWARAAGWAVNFASAMIEWSDSGLEPHGRRTIARLMED